MKAFKLVCGAGMVMLFSTLGSCVSTDVVETPDTKESNQIVLNLSSLTEGTRADANHKLRYTAKLYEGTLNYLEDKTLIRKEIIEGDQSEEGATNQIIFDVPAGETYTIIVFADYIPADSKPGTNGLYSDYYYDTTSRKETFEMRTTPGSTSTSVSQTFFNNDNYDCFIEAVTVKKTEAKVVENMTLKRAVAKVRLIDTSTRSGSFNVSVTNLSYLNLFDRNNNAAFGPKPLTPNVKFNKELTGAPEQEVMYYYTFASKNEYEKLNLNVTIEDSDSEKSNLEIKDIKIEQNYITTIKGKLLPDEKSTVPDTPVTPDPDNQNGPIYLNLSVSNDPWQNQSQAWQ